MATPAAQKNQRAGRVTAGSTNITRVPIRGYRKRRATAEARRQQRSVGVIAPTRPSKQKTKPTRKQITGMFKKGTGSMRAVVISGTLFIPAILQTILAVALSYAIGFLNLGFVAWASQAFTIVDQTADYFFAGMWIVLIVLNLCMFLYSMTAYLISAVNVFKPIALVALAIFFTLSLFPPVNIVPWVLFYVWVVALTR